jgi:hypothetical protein
MWAMAGRISRLSFGGFWSGALRGLHRGTTPLKRSKCSAKGRSYVGEDSNFEGDRRQDQSPPGVAILRHKVEALQVLPCVPMKF